MVQPTPPSKDATQADAAAPTPEIAQPHSPPRTRRAELADRITALGAAHPSFAVELGFALRYIEDDAGSSLTKSRLVMERLVFAIFAAEMGRDPKRAFLKDMLADNQFTRTIERRILSRMNAIRDMANLGPHGESVKPEDAARVLEDLCDVIEWHGLRPTEMKSNLPTVLPPRSPQRREPPAMQQGISPVKPRLNPPPGAEPIPASHHANAGPNLPEHTRTWRVKILAIASVFVGGVAFVWGAVLLPTTSFPNFSEPDTNLRLHSFKYATVMGLLIGGTLATLGGCVTFTRRDWGRCFLAAAAFVAVMTALCLVVLSFEWASPSLSIFTLPLAAYAAWVIWDLRKWQKEFS